MKLIEITLNAELDSDGYPRISGTIVGGDEPVEIKRIYSRGGNLMFPLFHTLIAEMKKMDNTTIVVFSNIRKFKEQIRSIETERREIALQLKKIARQNNLILLADKP